MENIQRKYYLNKILPYINKNIIKVLAGQRRVGKSYILRQIMSEIELSDENANIIYINREDYGFKNITDADILVEYIQKHESSVSVNYLFIDEIQEIRDFQLALRHFMVRDNYDIYCTGSNASLLSGELATLLSGRYIEFKIHSLSYTEFLVFHKLEDTNDSLYSYLRYGGMPYLIHLPFEDEIIFTYLVNVYNSIVLKDVVQRYNIRNVDFLQRLIEFLADNCGSIISAKKISDFLKSQKINISPNIVLNYLEYLRSAFFIRKIKRQDIIGKKIFEIGEKIYFEDIGLRNSIIGYKQADISKLIENCICHHLHVYDYSIHIGTLGDKEIDFIASRGDSIIYIQAAYLIPDEKVRQREFGNLLAIPDNYPKVVVSLDEPAGGNYKGIKHIHLRAFLSMDPKEL